MGKGGKTMAKAKRSLAKSKKSKAKKNLDTFYLKAKVTALVTPSQGVSTSNYIYGTYHLMNETSTVACTNIQEFVLYKNLYDRVRINSVKVTVTPKANYLALNSAQNDGYTQSGDGMIHTVIDRDGPAAGNKARMTRYPSYRKYSVLKTWSRSYSVKYPQGVWLDCQNIYEDKTLLKRLGLFGGMTVFAENILEDNGELVNEPLYDVLVEYGCVFQGRGEGSLSYNTDTKAITVTPSNESAYPTPTDPVPMSGTIADKRYDASGNLVTVTDTDNP